MKFKIILIFSALLQLALSTASTAYSQGGSAVDKEKKQFTFSWQFQDSDAMRPRGGTTKGSTVELSNESNSAWRKLSNEEHSNFERDRHAILSMAGNHRVTFDFIETIVHDPISKPDRPYQSWGTEYVLVIEDNPQFISLQHILVMTFVDKDGKTSKPMVMKHWRQDWQYAPSQILVHNLTKGWHRRQLTKESANSWSQTVYQVDDSPRYASTGKWNHFKKMSVWESKETLRPLPRREFSVRSDYDVLWGTNRITVLPSGWVQEEDNLKMVITNPQDIENNQSFKAREAGIARYELISNLDISAAEDYWRKTKAYWQDVRVAWTALIEKNDQFWIRKKVSNRPLFSRMFAYAAALEKEDNYDAESSREFVAETLSSYTVFQQTDQSEK